MINSYKKLCEIKLLLKNLRNLLSYLVMIKLSEI